MTSEVLGRCALVTTRVLEGDCSGVGAAVAALTGLPADTPGVGAVAGQMAEAITRSPDRDLDRLRYLTPLLELADRQPPTWPNWEQVRNNAGAAAAMADAAVLGHLDPRKAQAHLERLGTMLPDHPLARKAYGMMSSLAALVSAVKFDDHEALRRVPGEIRAHLDDLRDDPTLGPMTAQLGEALALIEANQRGDQAGTLAAMDRLRAAADRDGPVLGMENALRLIELMRPIIGGTGSISGEDLAAIRQITEGVGPEGRFLADTAFLASYQGMAELHNGWGDDPDRALDAVESFRRSVAASSPDNANHATYLQGLALALVRRSEVTGSVADLREAAEVASEAERLVSGPGDPVWHQAQALLGQLRTRLGEHDRSRRPSLNALRKYTFDVMVNADPAAAARAARDAAAEALEVARNCLGDGAVVEALEALDAGRGLMLFAATESRDVAARLLEAGHADLAAAWTAADGPTFDQRREAMVALRIDELFAPPSTAEIAAALAQLDVDAVLYLVPGSGQVPGFVAGVAADGRTGYFAQTELRLDDEADMTRHLRVISSRHSRDVRPVHEGEQVSGSVEALCDWAWRAVVRPILDQYVPTLQLPSGRLPRLVLIPMGNLARVPWQAARRDDGTFAIELVAFSQAVSARMLCRTAELAPLAPAPVGLIVGDPDPGRTDLAGPDLTWARIEAYAIRRAFYPGARYVGRQGDGTPSPSGAGTETDVISYFERNRPIPGGVVHLACHAMVQPDDSDTSSYLLLADGTRLTAERLVGLLAGGTDPGIRLVVLAACVTGVSGRGYDEAYSLGTAFLAGGVRSVLSTQWYVPDEATSVLMYMFHHYGMVERLPVWEALRRAQLWMIRPDRVVPDRMPRRMAAQIDPDRPVDVASWAGFVHWGQ